MRKFIVFTHIGKFETSAISPAKAISNVRFRLFGNRGYVQTYSWEAKEVA